MVPCHRATGRQQSLVRIDHWQDSPPLELVLEPCKMHYPALFLIWQVYLDSGVPQLSQSHTVKCHYYHQAKSDQASHHSEQFLISSKLLLPCSTLMIRELFTVM